MDMTLLDDQGNFTDGFHEALPGILEVDEVTSDVYKNTGNIEGLLKSHHNLEKKIGEKPEGIIAPGENATDEEKSEYNRKLLGALGLAETPAEFDFAQGEMPEGLRMGEAEENQWREFFHKQNFPKPLVNALMKQYNEMKQGMVTQMQERIEAEDKAAWEKLTANYSGDKLTELGRNAVHFLRAFGSEQAAKELDGAKIHDAPGDRERWKSVGLAPHEVEMYGRAGEKMRAGKFVPNEGKGDEPKDEVAEAGKNRYNHPTSKQLVENR
jgi:hypothetical protein